MKKEEDINKLKMKNKEIKNLKMKLRNKLHSSIIYQILIYNKLAYKNLQI